MRVCLYNVFQWPRLLYQKIGVAHHKAQRLQGVARFIAKEEFAIVFLQELYAEEDIETLKSLLPQYHVYAPSYESTLGGFWSLNLSGLVIVSKERLVFVKQIPFAQQSKLDSFLRINRSMLWAYTTETHILLCNVHLTPTNSIISNMFESHDDIIIDQLKQLYYQLKTLYAQPDIQPQGWIIGGDFNEDHRSRVFQTQNPLLKMKSFYTTLATPSCNNQVEFAHEWADSGLCVDHLFSSFKIIEQAKPKLDLSDHYPITAKLLLE